ncbi:hypothetical protein ACFPJ4_13380 [Lysinimonas soli]|uniref:Uncharacterized protein n=1 Tax=Lysinimonas soli TaxID=1074233 RepID=A0ABW0NS49_9MICO
MHLIRLLGCSRARLDPLVYSDEFLEGLLRVLRPRESSEGVYQGLKV